MQEFTLQYREWARNFTEAFTPIFEMPDKGTVDDVAITFDPPDSGILICRITTGDGHQIAIPLCDIHPPFIPLLRWLERLCEYGVSGRKDLESLRLDSILHSYSLAMFQLGKTEDSTGLDEDLPHDPVSFLVITRSDDREPAFTCTCNTNLFIMSFYSALRDALAYYSARFDDTTMWRCHRDYFAPKIPSQSGTLLNMFRSEEIEKMICSDKDCQNAILPLHRKNDR